MSLNGGWVSYSGDAKIELAVGLLAVAGCAAYAGIRLRRPVRAVRPPTSVVVLMFSLWVIALIAFLAGLGIYVHQFLHDFPHITSGVSDPIAPVTLLAAAAIFGIVMTRTGWRYQTRLGSAVVGAMAAPMIFELPFDLSVMARTYPALPPDPALYRAVFFTPLFLVELTTLWLLTLSPMVRVRRSTFFCFALMIGVFGIWALSGLGYPQSALPITMNVVSKILAFATALTLFLPDQLADWRTDGPANAPSGEQAPQPVMTAPAPVPPTSERRSAAGFRWRPAVAGVTLLAAAGLAAAGCSTSSGSSSSVAGCSGQQAGAASTVSASSASPGAAAAWTLPGGDMQNTRDVASAITSANVGRLAVAWCVPIESTGEAHSAGLTDGYTATPVVVNGVVYLQDMESNVMAIRLATGKVLWTHNYNSPNGGPDGVNVANGVVYAATNHAAVALNAATGRQLWSRTLIGNDHEGIDMAPGYNHGTVYVSTVPVNPTVGQYLGGGKGILWALNARTGAPEWSWDEVQNLWGNPGVNSGGGLWDPPSFDAQGNLYVGIANPGPIGEGGWPKGYPWGTSRRGPDLYTDSVVKLSPAGRLLWYYQLTPHDLYDWDLQNSPVLTTANGQPVVIDGGKAGILIELNARTGELLWKLPVGVHSGHDNDGLLTENATPTSHMALPARYVLEPSVFGGVESPLASNGTTVFAAVNNLAMPMTAHGVAESSKAFDASIATATGEMVAVNQDTGKIIWDVKLPSSPYGAAAVTNGVVFTTTYSGYLYAFSAATGAILLKTPLSSGANAPVAIDGDYVIAGAGVQTPKTARQLIIAYKVGANGKLPDTVAP